MLQILLHLPEPAYCHHRLIVDADGRKLAKSQRDKALRSLRAEGVSREEVLVMADATDFTMTRHLSSIKAE
jgi:glutamyl-Q tRNA(Asp) synthetase